MSPEEIKELRRNLQCTARELAAALDLDQATVMAWERGDLFPTKQFVDRMETLRQQGPSAIPKKAKGPDPMKVMTDPALWLLFRKMLAHKKLRDECSKLAQAYDDPAE